MPSIGDLNEGPEAEELLDVDIDRSEFDKYLSGDAGAGGYSNNPQAAVTSVSMSTSTCPYYGSADLSSTTANGSTFIEMSHHHHDTKENVNDYPLMKSEPLYETIPGSSLSSALADVRSVYYDC